MVVKQEITVNAYQYYSKTGCLFPYEDASESGNYLTEQEEFNKFIGTRRKTHYAATYQLEMQFYPPPKQQGSYRSLPRRIN